MAGPFSVGPLCSLCLCGSTNTEPGAVATGSVMGRSSSSLSRVLRRFINGMFLSQGQTRSLPLPVLYSPTHGKTEFQPANSSRPLPVSSVTRVRYSHLPDFRFQNQVLNKFYEQS